MSNKKHGLSNTRLYRIWQGMKSRCNPNSKKDTKYYSDKGIKVCDEWQDFENFLFWSIGML